MSTNIWWGSPNYMEELVPAINVAVVLVVVYLYQVQRL